MRTNLTEAEAIINLGPLTYVHNDVDEPQPLTPAHFLVGQRPTCLPPRPFPADIKQGGDDTEVAIQTETYDQLLEQMAERIFVQPLDV